MRHKTRVELVAYNCHLLEEIADLLRKLPGTSYTDPIPGYTQATIGKHIRHILEFYECLDGGLQADCTVNYDARKRNPSYENHPGAAIEAIEQISTALKTLTDCESLQLVLNYDPANEAVSFSVPSSLERELAYVFEHAVHHLALVRLALHFFAPDFRVPESFGVAPATLRNN